MAKTKRQRTKTTKQLTLRSALGYIVAHPGCTVNDVLDAHDLSLDASLDEENYLDREATWAAILGALSERGDVTYAVTSFEGWKYTATEQGESRSSPSVVSLVDRELES